MCAFVCVCVCLCSCKCVGVPTVAGLLLEYIVTSTATAGRMKDTLLSD
jgi:hypothetical protein